MGNVQGYAVVAQSGGPTAVINSSACGVIQEALQSGGAIQGIFGANRGILGLLQEDLFDLGAHWPTHVGWPVATNFQKTP